MKKFFAIVISAVLAASLAACGSAVSGTQGTQAASAEESTPAPAPVQSQAAATSAAEEHEPAVVSFWHYPGSDGTNEAYADFAKKVNELYPWITVEFEELSWDSGPEKFTIACATNTTPDIYVDGYSRIAPAVQAGLTLDITDVIEANRDNLLYETQLDGMVDDEIHFFLLRDGLPYGILVNMDMARELGVADMLPEDKLTWSYDEYLAVCRAAKAANPSIYAQDLFAGSRSSDAWYYTWFLGNGSKITDASSKTLFNDPEYRQRSLEVLALLKTLVDEELAPAGCATAIDIDIQELWYSEQCMMAHCGYNNAMDTYMRIQEGTMRDFDYDIYALPTKDGKEPGISASWGSSGWCCFGNHGHDEATRLVLDTWIRYPEYATRILSINGLSGSFIKGVTLEFPTDEIKAIMDRAVDYGAEKNRSDFGILKPWWSDFRETFYPQLQDFYIGKIDAQTVLDNWQAAGDKVISDYNAANP